MALVHHLARCGTGERMLVVAAMGDEPLPEAAALVRSRLLGRGAAVELALGPLDRSALAAVARRAAGRPLPPGTLDAIARSSAGNPFFAEELAASVDASGEVTMSARLREVVGQRLERLELFGEPLLAALAVIEDGFTEAALMALARHRWCRGGARRGPVGRRARAHARTLPLPARTGARAAGGPAARGGSAACPRRRCGAPRRGGLAAGAGRPSPARRRPRAGGCPAPRRGGRVGLGRGRLPRRCGAGPSWRYEHAPDDERPRLLMLRAQLLHGAGEPDAPAAYAEAIEVAPAGAGARAACAARARVHGGGRHRRRQGRARAVQGRAARRPR